VFNLPVEREKFERKGLQTSLLGFSLFSASTSLALPLSLLTLSPIQPQATVLKIMSYADAAHHAPSTSDPTPDPSLLESNQPANSPEHAEQVKHVRVASSTPATQDTPSTVPQKRENEQSSSSTATNGSTAASGKKKKGKKGNKKVESSEEEKKGEEKKVEGGKVKESEKESKPPQSKKEVEQPKKEEVTKEDDKKKQESKVEEKKEEEKPKQDKKESEEKSVSKPSNDKEESSKPSNDKEESTKEEEEEKKPAGSGFKTELEGHPSMKERPTAPKDLDKKLADPCESLRSSYPLSFPQIADRRSCFSHRCRSRQHRCYRRFSKRNYRE